MGLLTIDARERIGGRDTGRGKRSGVVTAVGSKVTKEFKEAGTNLLMSQGGGRDDVPP